MTLNTIIAICTLSCGSGVLVSIVKYFNGRIQKNDVKTEAVCHGVQALLRDRLYNTYDKWVERGYAPRHVKENFENMYSNYHSLGANGVMDNHYVEFMKLPDNPVKN